MLPIKNLPPVNIEKVDSLNQKRTLAFVNHWIITMVNFVNQFAEICEVKLYNINRKLQQAEDSLAILEVKLKSIHGLEEITVPVLEPQTISSSTVCEQSKEETGKNAGNSVNNMLAVQPTHQLEATENTEENNGASASSVTVVSQHPQFASFFKMVSVGVPVQAVKLKMAALGLDPSILDNPSAPAPTEPIERNSARNTDDEELSWSE